MKKANHKDSHNNNHNNNNNHSNNTAGETRSSGKTGTRHKSVWHKTAGHPISTPLFIFYIIMSVINGSAFLLFLGAAAALGAWAVEELFMATSGLADSGRGFRDRSDMAASDRSSPEKELFACSRSETSAHFSELLSRSSRGGIVFIRKKAS